MHEGAGVARAVRVVPDNPDAAPLTFVFTTYPGVLVHAGLLHDFAFPQCGCDACDESVDSLAEEMEWLVFAVAQGGYRESLSTSLWLGVKYEIVASNGSHKGGASSEAHYPAERLETAGKRLERLPHGWEPWEPA
jgi:hypothetical protein